MVSISSEKLNPDHLLSMGAGSGQKTWHGGPDQTGMTQKGSGRIDGQRWKRMSSWSEILKGKANTHLFSYQNHLYDLMTRWHDPPNQLVKIQAHTQKKMQADDPFLSFNKNKCDALTPWVRKSKTMVGHFALAIGNNIKIELRNAFSKRPFFVYSHWATLQEDCN